MSLARTSSILSIVFWGICAAGFFTVAFTGGGVETFAEDSGRHATGAVFILFGLVVAPLARWIVRRRSSPGAVLTDERDERVQAKALMVTLVLVTMIVFLTAFFLWERYQEAGAVPVGWMWVIAYGTMIVTNLTAPALVLMTDVWGWADGR